MTEEQEQALLSFIKTDNVYHKYYDDVLILLKTGLRISELCGLTIMDVDFIHEVVVIDHQLLKSKEQGYYIETPKTKSGTRQVPLSKETIQAFQRVMKKRPKAEPFVIDGAIRIVNWIAGILFAVVLVLILMRLHNPPDEIGRAHV